MASEGTITSGRNESLWITTHQQPTFAPLVSNASADVCIIGGGITGLTTAYLLGREGLSVIVLEDGLVGSGETGRTTAHISNVIDDRYAEIERIHGERGARLAAESHTAAIDRIQQAVEQEGIDCDYKRVTGYLILSEEHQPDLLANELEAAKRAGLTVQWLDRCPLVPVPRPCLRFPHQAQFHPLKYLAGLAEAVRRGGGQIHTHTHAADIQSGPRRHVQTVSGPTIDAGSVVVATNTPVNDRVMMHIKQAPYRTYVVGVLVPHDSVPLGLYWDTSDPYHYVRLQAFNDSEDVLIVGGEDHRTGQADSTTDRYGRLMDWARRWFPMVKKTEAFRWSGQVMESVDGLGFIGRQPGGDGHTYIATGDSGMGITHGTIAGLLLTDLICGRENQWANLYDPARVPLRAGSEFARENISMAAQYADWVRPGQVEDIDDIAPGQGAIIRKGLTKLAVYRDPAGKPHIRSAVCPHLRCIVRWNAEEETWDCPCHGSRFNRFGKVLNGPANTDLSAPE